MLTVGFWFASKMLFGGRGFSWLVCGLVALPFDIYLLLSTTGMAS
jgi:hypothetical protein